MGCCAAGLGPSTCCVLSLLCPSRAVSGFSTAARGGKPASRAPEWLHGLLLRILARDLAVGAGLTALLLACGEPAERATEGSPGRGVTALGLPRPGRSRSRLLRAGSREPRGNEPYDLVIVTLDTVRADRLSCYGYGRDTTPHLDALAAGGLRFTRCLAPVPTTLPSHTSMFTGVMPLRHGVLANLHQGLVYERDSGLQTLAQALAERGYATAGFVSALPCAGGPASRTASRPTTSRSASSARAAARPIVPLPGSSRPRCRPSCGCTGSTRTTPTSRRRPTTRPSMRRTASWRPGWLRAQCLPGPSASRRTVGRPARGERGLRRRAAGHGRGARPPRRGAPGARTLGPHRAGGHRGPRRGTRSARRARPRAGLGRPHPGALGDPRPGDRARDDRRGAQRDGPPADRAAAAAGPHPGAARGPSLGRGSSAGVGGGRAGPHPVVAAPAGGPGPRPCRHGCAPGSCCGPARGYCLRPPRGPARARGRGRRAPGRAPRARALDASLAAERADADGRVRRATEAEQAGLQALGYGGGDAPVQATDRPNGRARGASETLRRAVRVIGPRTPDGQGQSLAPRADEGSGSRRSALLAPWPSRVTRSPSPSSSAPRPGRARPPPGPRRPAARSASSRTRTSPHQVRLIEEARSRDPHEDRNRGQLSRTSPPGPRSLLTDPTPGAGPRGAPAGAPRPRGLGGPSACGRQRGPAGPSSSFPATWPPRAPLPRAGAGPWSAVALAAHEPPRHPLRAPRRAPTGPRPACSRSRLWACRLHAAARPPLAPSRSSPSTGALTWATPAVRPRPSASPCSRRSGRRRERGARPWCSGTARSARRRPLARDGGPVPSRTCSAPADSDVRGGRASTAAALCPGRAPAALPEQVHRPRLQPPPVGPVVLGALLELLLLAGSGWVRRWLGAASASYEPAPARSERADGPPRAARPSRSP